MGAALPFIALGAQGAGAGMGVLGGITNIISGRRAADYQTQVAKNNLKIAKWNSYIAKQEGETAATNEGLKGRAMLGAITAQQAASGVDINTGSPVDVRASASRIAQLNSMTIKSDAARRAYGFDLASKQARAEEKLARASKPGWIRSLLGLSPSVLGSASSIGGNIMQYDQAGAFDFGSATSGISPLTATTAGPGGLNTATGMLGAI